MLVSAFDGISKLLAESFPKVKKTYIVNMPNPFKRPCFFLDYVTSSTDYLSTGIYQQRSSWQIIYFANLAKEGKADIFEQLKVAEQIERLFIESKVLYCPNGDIFHVEHVEGEPRDDEVYMMVDLWTTQKRKQNHDQYDIMKEIEHKFKEVK